MKIELSKDQIDLLLQVINQQGFKGEHVETISELKRVLKTEVKK